ncbi:MAG TPA: arabinofuranosidase, partial [Sphingobium sp.]|nr:arabinofuranosidase [Sphingobium sp.]
SPILMPDHYLVAAKDGTVTLQPDSKSADFSLRSQFVRLEEKGQGLLRFAAVGAPGKAIGMVDGQVALVASRDSSAYWRAD